MLTAVISLLVRIIAAIAGLGLIKSLLGNNLNGNEITLPKDYAGRNKVMVLCLLTIVLFVAIVVWSIKFTLMILRWVLSVFRK